jgi:RNA polymerase sigma-70 factor (ECF subfamily)
MSARVATVVATPRMKRISIRQAYDRASPPSRPDTPRKVPPASPDVEPFPSLVRRLDRGVILESEEIAALYAAYGGELWRALLVVSAGRVDVAKEATAEAFARLVANAESVREPRGWLYRTGYRAVVDQLRRERRVSHDLPEQAARDVGIGFSPELSEAVARLSPAQRLAVFLTYQAGMSLREVAEATGSPVATVKVRLYRARRALRAVLEAEEVDARA